MRTQPPGRLATVTALLAVALLATVIVAAVMIARLGARDEPAAGPAPLPPVTGGPGDASGDPCGGSRGATVAVRDAAQLARALATARPGQAIRMADGTYTGEFHVTVSGTDDRPIVLCGSRRAVLRGGEEDEGYGLWLEGASHWVLRGFTVTEVQKGIVLDRASSNRLTGLAVFGTGQEAVHLRTFSSDNVLERSEIRDTGLDKARFGEGVYVGSAVNNWCEYTACRPDTSDRNQIIGNRIGPGTGAEAIDIKEGTTGGTVRGNTLLGEDMDDADSWIDVKGNGWRIEGNTGTDTPEDGFQVHVEQAGWGRDNVFSGNVADLGDGEYGFRIDEDAVGTVVHCDNQVTGASEGLANIACS